RNKVDVYIQQEAPTIKKMTLLDKERLSYKSAINDNNWSRLCQNSGENERRRPQQHLSSDSLIKEGYKYNKKSGYFEKTYKGDILRAIKLDNFENNTNQTDNG